MAEKPCCNVVGYGSLLCPNSLTRTIRNEKAMRPVWIKGYKRVFNLSFNKGAMLNVVRSHKHSFNAMIFSTLKSEIDRLHRREWPYNIEETDIYDYYTGRKIGKALIYVADEESGKGVFDPSSSVKPDSEYLKFARICAYNTGEDFGKDFDRTTFLNNDMTIDEYIGEAESVKAKPGRGLA